MARSEERKAAKRVLMIRFSALGDVAMAIPAVYDVCTSNPDTQFLFLTRQKPAQLFINRPENLDVRGIDLNAYRGVGGLYRLHKEIEDEFGPDVVADLHNVIRSKIMRMFWVLKGRKVRHMHKGRRGKRALTRRHNKILLPLISNRARYREVFHHAGLQRVETFKSLFKGYEPDRTLYSNHITPKREGEQWIAIAPFALHEGKIYPLEQMEQVVDHYAKMEHVRVFLLGSGKKENEILDKWSKKSPRVFNLAAMKLGLHAELTLFNDCDVMLSMDSANMHMASLVKLRTVSVWGATHPYCGFMGWHQKASDTIQLDMVCRPCSVFGNKPCHRGDYHCLRGIRPSRIIAKIDDILGLGQ